MNGYPRTYTPVYKYSFAWSAGAVEHTDCTTAEGYNPTNVKPAYDTKQSDDEVSVTLVLWGNGLPDLLWPGVITPDRVLSMSQIELNSVGWKGSVFAVKLYIYAKLNSLKWNCFDI